jgi:hypothetical protein
MYRTRRPRRSRFTATLQREGVGVTRKVILCYTAQDAVDYYSRRGWTVLNVVKGDLVNAGAPTGAGWKLANLQDALDFLGLTLPVKIKQTGHRGGRYGAYSLRIGADGRPYHHITVKSWLTVYEAGRTLWHELTHAMQAERAALAAGAVTPAEFLAAWRTTDERAGSYRVRSIEVEARSFEAFNDETPLAVQA